MKILLIGEYSNVHATLAEGLRKMGQQVTVLSNGDFWKDYPRDINLVREYDRFGGLRYYLRLLFLLPKLHGYDIVQLINPIFLELKPERIPFIYRFLRRHNKRVLLGAFGMDWYWVNGCANLKLLRYSDFNIGDNIRHDLPAEREYADWLCTAKERLNKFIAQDCDGIISGLYEYDVCYRPYFPEKTCFIPYPIESYDNEPKTLHKDGKLRFFVGISKNRSNYKGTDIMLRAVERIQEKHPDRVMILKAEGLPFTEYKQMMDEADVVLDQLYSYTPAMNGLLALSKGKILVGGGEEENYEILGETELRPIINVLPDEEDVYQKLEQLVMLSPEEIMSLKHDSQEYIRRHHDYLKVARKYLTLYSS